MPTDDMPTDDMPTDDMPTGSLVQSTNPHSSATENKEDIIFNMPPEQLAPIAIYLTENRLGTGSHGDVFKVRVVCSDEPTTVRAIKVFSTVEGESQQRSLATEVPALLKKIQELPHQNIISIYNLFTATASINLVMSYADLGSLADLITAVGPIAEPILGKITFQILQGLNHLHSVLNLVHGNMNLSNVLLFSNGVVKISNPLQYKLNSITNADISRSDQYYYSPPEKIKVFRIMRNQQEDKMFISEKELEEYEKKFKESQLSKKSIRTLQKADIWALGLIVATAFFGRLPILETDGAQISEDLYLTKLGLNQVVVDFPEVYKKLGITSFAPASDALKLFVWSSMSQSPADRPPASNLITHAYIKDNIIKETKASSEKSSIFDDTKQELKTWFKANNIEQKRKAALLKL